jgi:hypothetical protein
MKQHGFLLQIIMGSDRATREITHRKQPGARAGITTSGSRTDGNE